MIKKQMAFIRQLSLESYNSTHKKALSSNFTLVDLEPAQTGHLLNLVLEGRLAARAIYRSCYGLRAAAMVRLTNMQASPPPQFPIYLEIDLVRDDDLMDIQKAALLQCLNLDFDLIVPDPNATQKQLRQMFIHGPLPLTSIATSARNVQARPDILVQVCEALRDGRDLEFNLLCREDKNFGFRSRCPSEDEKLSLFKEGDYDAAFKPLKTLLYNMDLEEYGKRNEPFTWSERYCLAYKIAECGLMLCGTSWLSGLRIHHLRHSRKTLTEPRKYVLVRELPIGEADVDEETLVEIHVTQLGNCSWKWQQAKL